VIFHCCQRATLYALAFVFFVVARCCGPLFAQPKTKLVVGANVIGGQVEGVNGPEAGVWVIAETSDLPTRYGLLISLAALSLTYSIVGARADDSRPLPSPSAAPTTIDQCQQQYDALWQDVEAKGEPISNASQASHGRLSAHTACKLITIYEKAERRMLDFIEANSNKCGAPQEFVEKNRIHHAMTEKLKGQVCSKVPELR
jgi:hypothetical protein